MAAPQHHRSASAARPSSDAWLELALESAHACGWSWDAGTGRLELAGAAAALLGAEPATLDALEALVHEEDRPVRRRAVTRALERGEPWVAVFRLQALGDGRWIEERGRGLAGAGGRAERAVAIAVDVTGRREHEAGLELRLRRESRERHAAQAATGTAEAALKALARSEAFLESIFASMADGLVLFAPDGRITRINPSARQMLGLEERPLDLTLDECVSRIRVLDVDGKVVPRERLPAALALAGQAVRGQTHCLDLPDGRKVWTVCGAAPIHTPAGDVAGAVLTLGDVTRLREAHEDKEDLSRMISHDLRAPLSVVLAQSKLIGRRNEGMDAIRARAEAIATSAQRMTAMLNDLVESALLDAGRLRLERDSVDPCALLRDLCVRVATPYGEERVRIDAAPGVGTLVGDANRLERVFTNLVTNALKYSAPGTEVAVRVAGDAAEVVVEVEDRGQGIAEADLPHLFERFFRALGSSRHEGMGLGLYTARRLVEAHGGTIGVTSVAGKGSVFRVRLPRR
jgi:PAS domain S-box-containing protein